MGWVIAIRTHARWMRVDIALAQRSPELVTQVRPEDRVIVLECFAQACAIGMRVDAQPGRGWQATDIDRLFQVFIRSAAQVRDEVALQLRERLRLRMIVGASRAHAAWATLARAHAARAWSSSPSNSCSGGK